MQHPNPFNVSIDALLEALQAKGFKISIDVHLDIQRVLRELEPGTDLQTLKTLLAPLLAKNEEEQASFYRTFDLIAGAASGTTVNEEQEQPDPLPVDKRVWLSRKQRILLFGSAVAIVCLAFFALYWAMQPEELAEHNDPSQQEQTGQSGVEGTTGSSGNPSNPEPKPKPIDPEPDPKPVHEPEERGKPEAPIQRAAQEETKPPVQLPYVDLNAPDISALATSAPGWLERNFNLLRWWFIALVLAVWALNEYLRYRRQVLAARRQKGLKPPYTWPIVFGNEPRVELDEDFYSATQQFRRRVDDSSQLLDVAATVAATTRQAGALDVVYAQRTRPAEYLILIDRNNVRNHQSSLFDFLAWSLTRNDIHIDRYFYDGDPRICWNEYTPGGVKVEQLFNEHPNHRLLIFGTGARLIDAASGQVAEWVKRFTEWKQRAILTQRPSADWDYRELILNDWFVVLPGTSQGMKELIEHFEQLRPADLAEWKFDAAKSASGVDLSGSPQQAIERLKNYLPVELHPWIAACCLYPEVFWDLTLHIGTVLEDNEADLLTQENLLRLSRIDWFRDGRIPDAFRQLMMFDTTMLPEYQRKRVAAALSDLFRKSTPDDASTYAWQKHRMELIVNELLLDPKGREKRKLLNELRDLNEGRKRQDFTALMFLERMKTGVLDFVLPPEARKLFYKGGFSYKGMRQGVRTASALGMIALAFLVPALSRDCSNSMQLNGAFYCTDSPNDSALVLMNAAEQNYRASYEHNATAKEQLQQAQQLQGGTGTAYIMRQRMHYNHGLYLINNGRFYEAMLHLDSVSGALADIEERYWEYAKMICSYNLGHFEFTPEYKATYAAWIAGLPPPNLQTLLERDALIAEGEKVPAYPDVGYMTPDGLRLVMNSEGLYGYHVANDLMISYRYPLAKPFKNGFAGVYEGEYWGFLDSSGNPIGEFRFGEVGTFSNGLANCRIGSRWVFINNTNSIVLDEQWVSAAPFKDGLAVVGVRSNAKNAGKLYGIIDTTGKEIVAPTYRELGSFSNGLAAFQDTAGKWGYLNTSGREQIAAKYDAAQAFEEGVALVSEAGSWTLIDVEGNTIPFANTEKTAINGLVYPFSEGKAVFNEAGSWGWVDRTGAIVYAKEAVEGLPVYRLGDYSSGFSRARLGSNDNIAGFTYFTPDGSVLEVADSAYYVLLDEATDFRSGAAGITTVEGEYVLQVSGFNDAEAQTPKIVMQPLNQLQYGFPEWNLGNGHLVFNVLDGFAFSSRENGTLSIGPTVSGREIATFPSQDRIALDSMGYVAFYDPLGRRCSRRVDSFVGPYANGVASIETRTHTYLINKGGRCVYGCPDQQSVRDLIDQQNNGGAISELLSAEFAGGLGTGMEQFSGDQLGGSVWDSEDYEIVSEYQDYWQVISKEGKLGLLGGEARVINFGAYDAFEPVQTGETEQYKVFWRVEKNDKFGLFSNKGEPVLEIIYDDIALKWSSNKPENLPIVLTVELGPNLLQVLPTGECAFGCAGFERQEITEALADRFVERRALESEFVASVIQINEPFVVLDDHEGGKGLFLLNEQRQLQPFDKTSSFWLPTSETAIVYRERDVLVWHPDWDEALVLQAIDTTNAPPNTVVPVKKDGEWWHYDLTYNDFVPNVGPFKTARPFYGDFAAVELPEGWTYVDAIGGEVIFNSFYREVSDFNADQFASVRTKKGWNIIDNEFGPLLPEYFDEVKYLGNNMVYGRTKGSKPQYALFNLEHIGGNNGEFKVGTFDRVGTFSKGTAQVERDGARFKIDTNGKRVD